MKKIFILFAALCLISQAAHALIVNVDGQGEIPAEGIEITIDQAEEDPLSGEMMMELQGSTLFSSTLTVQITRSSAGLTDEFCCANTCTTGNGELTEELQFAPIGKPASWFIHYTPAEESYETIVYRFTEGEESLVLTVHFSNGKDAPIPTPTSFPRKHLIEEFTGQDCGYCPAGMDAISEFMTNDTNWVLVLHHYGYASDNFTVSGSSTIGRQLSVSGAPSASIDRKATKTEETNTITFHPGYLPTVDKSQFDSTTYASINIANSYDSVTRKLTVKVTGLVVKENPPALKLTILVKESGMIDYQADYSNTFEGWEQFRHANAVRVFMTTSTGKALTITDGQYTVEAQTTIKDAWVPENCMVVAFLSENTKPVIQVAERPVVDGTTGGADIEHGGIKKTEVADYYPEPSASAAPSDYSSQREETMTYATTSYTTYDQYNFNYWTIMAYDNTRTVKVSGTSCYPFAYIYLFTEISQTTLPYGTFAFSTSMQPGTAYAGYRNDAESYVDGSEFYFVSQSYFNQGYLYPYAEWLIAEGTLVISETGWSVTGHARNGKPINLVGTTPINDPNKPQGIEETGAGLQGRGTKILRDGRLILITPEGTHYDAIGARMK